MLYFKVIEQNQVIYAKGEGVEIFDQMRKVSSNPNNLMASIKTISQNEFEQNGVDLDVYTLAR